MSSLHYQLVGEGPPLLLLHGFGISYNIWQGLIPLLAEHFHLIVVDLPGIGASPPIPQGRHYYATCADLLDELRRELSIEVWSILCYSIGTRVGETYVQRYPATVDGCILLCPLHVPGLRWQMLQWAIRMDAMLPLFGEWVLSGPLLYALVIGLGFNWRLGPHVSAWTREIGAQPLDVLRQILRDLPDDGRHLPKLGVRARFIWGRYDLIAVRPVDFDDTHVHINANHAAPVLVAPEVASLTINFLTK